MAGVLLYCLSSKYHALFSSIFGFHFIYELVNRGVETAKENLQTA